MEHRAVVALDVDAAAFADGANIQQCTGNGTGGQRFAIEAADPSNPTVYKLVNQTSGKCADIQDWSLAHKCMQRGGRPWAVTSLRLPSQRIRVPEFDVSSTRQLQLTLSVE